MSEEGEGERGEREQTRHETNSVWCGARMSFSYSDGFVRLRGAESAEMRTTLPMVQTAGTNRICTRKRAETHGESVVCRRSARRGAGVGVRGRAGCAGCGGGCGAGVRGVGVYMCDWAQRGWRRPMGVSQSAGNRAAQIPNSVSLETGPAKPEGIGHDG